CQQGFMPFAAARLWISYPLAQPVVSRKNINRHFFRLVLVRRLAPQVQIRMNPASGFKKQRRQPIRLEYARIIVRSINVNLQAVKYSPRAIGELTSASPRKCPEYSVRERQKPRAESSYPAPRKDSSPQTTRFRNKPWQWTIAACWGMD